jgi:hypothetical protein
MEQQRFVRHVIAPHLDLGEQLKTTDEQPV